MKSLLLLIIFVMPLQLFCIDINYKRVSASNNEIHAFSKNEIIVAGENGKLIKTSNGGATWKWIETNCRNSFRHMNFNSKGLGVLSSNYEVLKSDDYGESWIYLKKSNTGDISKAFLDENGNVLIAHKEYLLSINYDNSKIDTIMKADSDIIDFIQEEYIYVVTKTNFYKIKDNNIIISNNMKGKYDSRINSIAVSGEKILVGGADTSNKMYSNFLFKSVNGGLSFDSLKQNRIGYVNRIYYYNDNFIALSSNGELFFYNSNFDSIKYERIIPRNVLKYNNDFIVVKDLYLFNNLLFFCGKANGIGYLDNEYLKIINYAPIQYLAPIKTNALDRVINCNNNIFVLSNYSKIFRSDSSGISWNIIFPYDTTSDSSIQSPWFALRENYCVFNGVYKYKQGYRFIGNNQTDIPMDVYMNNEFNYYDNIDSIICLQYYFDDQNNIFARREGIKITLKNEGKDLFIFFPSDSIFKKLEPSIRTINTATTINKFKNNSYILTKSAYLNSNDSINNPNKNDYIIFILEANLADSSMKILNQIYMKFSTGLTLNLTKVSNDKYILSGNTNTNVVRFLNADFKVMDSAYYDFKPGKFYVENDTLWIALATPDIVQITTNAGKTWNAFSMSNDTTEYENWVRTYKDIAKLRDNEYLLSGYNRITLLSIIQDEVSFEEKTVYDSKILNIFPIPATDLVSFEILNNSLVHSYNIFNSFGITVLSVELPEPSIRFSLNVSNLPSGTYYITCRTKNGDINDKFVINK